MQAEIIENRLFADIQIGDTAQLTRTVTAEDIDHYAAASGDFNPRAIALCGNRGWGTKEEAQPVLIVKDSTAFAAADAIAG